MRSQQAGVCKPRAEASTETSPANVLVSVSLPPDPWEIEYTWFMPPSLRFSVTEALPNQYALWKKLTPLFKERTLKSRRLRALTLWRCSDQRWLYTGFLTRCPWGWILHWFRYARHCKADTHECKNRTSPNFHLWLHSLVLETKSVCECKAQPPHSQKFTGRQCVYQE